MAKGWKERWREFTRGRPGHRFQDRYERKRSEGSGRSSFRRFWKPLAAGFLIVAGIVFCVIPGPGMPLLALGTCFLADVSRPVAVALDRMELLVRSLLSRFRSTRKGQRGEAPTTRRSTVERDEN